MGNIWSFWLQSRKTSVKEIVALRLPPREKSMAEVEMGETLSLTIVVSCCANDEEVVTLDESPLLHSQAKVGNQSS